MISFTDLKRRGYNAQRTASAGATITLSLGAENCTALFDCATRCASALGDRMLTDIGDGLFESIPVFTIPMQDLHAAIVRLSRDASVAIVAHCLDTGGFVLLWKVPQIVVENPEDIV